jgi:hypothetical protein
VTSSWVNRRRGDPGRSRGARLYAAAAQIGGLQMIGDAMEMTKVGTPPDSALA